MPESVTVYRPCDRLYLLALNPPLDGFDHFIGIWFYEGPPRVLVDVGPSATASQLVAALNRIGIDRLDYILMTHMHIDHGGGLAELSAAFPQTPVVGHSRGLPHVADPARLWAGSLKTLGATAEAYGPIAAVPANRLIAADDLNDPRVQVIFTPGHAPHHISYRVDRLLFAGEAGGVCLAAAPGRDFMRPATPPRFRMDLALSSLEALIDLPPSKICYSHFGLWDNARAQLTQHRDQLLRWQAIVADEIPRHPAGEAQAPCLQRLLQEDPLLHAFHLLPTGGRHREIGFLNNSLKGFIQALEEDPPAD